jgi:hypothetical protein
LSVSPLTTTAAAAPSQFAEHIGRVLGYAIITSFMICSSDIALLYAASGLSVEWLWFFSLIRANSSKSTPPYLWPYSMPTWANVPGIASVPTRPSVGATAPNRPFGVHVLPSDLGVPPPPSRPAPASFSTPTASPMSHSPAFTAMIAVRSAVAPVAHALATL